MEAVVEQYKQVPVFCAEFSAARQKVSDARGAQGAVRRKIGPARKLSGVRVARKVACVGFPMP
eukprot:2401951-Lingulodinium_polyedra.AAC.1